MTYYTIYKVTNKINGKIYIGSHKTKDLNDGYMGSGKYLKYAQEKHGIENFEKEILYVFDTPELMYAKEAEIVNEDFIAEENTYNLKVGGFGGFDYVNSNKKNLYGLNGTAGYGLENLLAAGGRNTKKRLVSQGRWEEYKEKISRTIVEGYRSGTLKNGFKGKRHSLDTKKRISEANAKNSKGTRNSQFGTMWITDGTESKKIKKTDTIPDGWYRGRKIRSGNISRES